jgi:soluble lytic murein transglycosylase-like protein
MISARETGGFVRRVILILALAAPAPALSGSLFSGGSLDSRLDNLLNGRLAEQYARPEEEEEIRAVAINPGPYRDMARQAAEEHGVPVELFFRLVSQESGWNPAAVSSKGAIGLAQLMPQTAARLGVDPRDAGENLEGGARYLSQQYRRFGSWRLALAAYNAGPEAVEHYDGVPPYAETENYVRAILN